MFFFLCVGTSLDFPHRILTLTERFFIFLNFLLILYFNSFFLPLLSWADSDEGKTLDVFLPEHAYEMIFGKRLARNS